MHLSLTMLSLFQFVITKIWFNYTEQDQCWFNNLCPVSGLLIWFLDKRLSACMYSYSQNASNGNTLILLIDYNKSSILILSTLNVTRLTIDVYIIACIDSSFFKVIIIFTHMIWNIFDTISQRTKGTSFWYQNGGRREAIL